MKAVAKDFYQLDITVEQVSYEEVEGKLSHHYMFNIEVLESAKIANYLERMLLSCVCMLASFSCSTLI